MIELRFVERFEPVDFDSNGNITTARDIRVLQFRDAILDPLTFVAGNSISTWTEWKDVPIVEDGK